MRFIVVVVVIFNSFIAFAQLPADMVSLKSGSVAFKSDAPLEIIEATSDELKGVIDFKNQTFAFTIPIVSFKGFNSALQREHFNENYMESTKFPKATFTGKLIEDIDINVDGEYKIRAKGKLIIHGVEQERIIQSLLKVKNGTVSVESSFTVLLADHNIAIPKVVHQKIAELINVKINADGEIK